MRARPTGKTARPAAGAPTIGSSDRGWRCAIGPRQPVLSNRRGGDAGRGGDASAARRLAFVSSAVFAWGFGFYAHGIYLVELQKAHGWSTGLISSVVTGHYVLGALAAGRSADFGPSRCSWAASPITGSSPLLLPSITAPWQLSRSTQ